jgi:hypothetical protein
LLYLIGKQKIIKTKNNNINIKIKIIMKVKAEYCVILMVVFFILGIIFCHSILESKLTYSKIIGYEIMYYDSNLKKFVSKDSIKSNEYKFKGSLSADISK